jgi:hypothetical protein
VIKSRIPSCELGARGRPLGETVFRQSDAGLRFLSATTRNFTPSFLPRARTSTDTMSSLSSIDRAVATLPARADRLLRELKSYCDQLESRGKRIETNAFRRAIEKEVRVWTKHSPHLAPPNVTGYDTVNYGHEKGSRLDRLGLRARHKLMLDRVQKSRVWEV